MVTNFDITDPPSMVKRYSRKEQKSVYVKQPQVIENCKKYIGDEELLDNFVAMYSSKKKK